MRLYIFIVCVTFFCCRKKNTNEKALGNINPKVSLIDTVNTKKVEKKINNFEITNTQWIEIQKKGEHFENLKSEWKRKVEVAKNKMLIELMEPSTYDIESITEKDGYFLFKIKGAEWQYRFKWENKEKHISRWDYIYNTKVDSSFSYYTIQEKYRNELK